MYYFDCFLLEKGSKLSLFDFHKKIICQNINKQKIMPMYENSIAELNFKLLNGILNHMINKIKLLIRFVNYLVCEVSEHLVL